MKEKTSSRIANLAFFGGIFSSVAFSILIDANIWLRLIMPLTFLIHFIPMFSLGLIISQGWKERNMIIGMPKILLLFYGILAIVWCILFDSNNPIDTQLENLNKNNLLVMANIGLCVKAGITVWFFGIKKRIKIVPITDAEIEDAGGITTFFSLISVGVASFAITHKLGMDWQTITSTTLLSIFLYGIMFTLMMSSRKKGSIMILGIPEPMILLLGTTLLVMWKLEPFAKIFGVELLSMLTITMMVVCAWSFVSWFLALKRWSIVSHNLDDPR